MAVASKAISLGIAGSNPAGVALLFACSDASRMPVLPFHCFYYFFCV